MKITTRAHVLAALGLGAAFNVWSPAAHAGPMVEAGVSYGIPLKQLDQVTEPAKTVQTVFRSSMSGVCVDAGLWFQPGSSVQAGFGGQVCLPSPEVRPLGYKLSGKLGSLRRDRNEWMHRFAGEVGVGLQPRLGEDPQFIHGTLSPSVSVGRSFGGMGILLTGYLEGGMIFTPNTKLGLNDDIKIGAMFAGGLKLSLITGLRQLRMMEGR